MAEDTHRQTRTYTVTLSGREREDQAKPYDYVVNAACLADAVRAAVRWHLAGDDESEEKIWVESCRPGVIRNGHFNDLREGTDQ